MACQIANSLSTFLCPYLHKQSSWESGLLRLEGLRMMQPENWIKPRKWYDGHMPSIADQSMDPVVHVLERVVGVTAVGIACVREGGIV